MGSMGSVQTGSSIPLAREERGISPPILYYGPDPETPMPQVPPDPPRLWRRDARKLIEPAVLIFCTLAFTAYILGLCTLLLMGNNPPGRDVISFWAAGRQIVAHANPYDSAAILKIERSVGFSDKTNVLIMRNPPSALCLVV